MNTKIIFLALLLVLFFSLTGLSCNKKNQNQASPTPTPTSTAPANLAQPNLIDTDPAAIETIASQNYELAKSKAISWKPDAVVVTAQVKLPADLALNKANETYIFGSASDTVHWWSFSVSEQTGKYIRAIIPKEDYLGTDAKPINVKYWRMNYAKALQLTDKSGGSEFRSANPDTQITATLHQAQPNNWLWWEIEYKSASSKLILKVNPNDANIVDEQGNPVSTGDTTRSETTGGAENNTSTNSQQ